MAIGKKKYEDNYIKNPDGSYTYIGESMVFDESIMPWSKASIGMFVITLVEFLAIVLAGIIMNTGLADAWYVQIPYIFTIVVAIYHFYKVIDLDLTGKELRDDLYDKTVGSFDLSITLIRIGGVLSVIAEIVRLFINEYTKVGNSVLMIALMAVSVIFATIFKKFTTPMHWNLKKYGKQHK